MSIEIHSLEFLVILTYIIGGRETMYTISKKDAINAIHEETGLAKKDINLMYDALANVILDASRNGEKFFMRGVFTLTPYERKATQRRNPRTGEVINVDAKTALRFTPGKLLRECLET